MTLLWSGTFCFPLFLAWNFVESKLIIEKGSLFFSTLVIELIGGWFWHKKLITLHFFNQNFGRKCMFIVIWHGCLLSFSFSFSVYVELQWLNTDSVIHLFLFPPPPFWVIIYIFFIKMFFHVVEIFYYLCRISSTWETVLSTKSDWLQVWIWESGSPKQSWG